MSKFLVCGVFFSSGRLESLFWKSDTHAQWAMWLDSWSVCFMITSHGFWLTCYSLMPAGRFRFLQSINASIFILIAAAQYIWMRLAPHNYYRFRTYVLIAHRALRVGAFLTSVTRFRREVNTAWFQKFASNQISSTTLFSPMIGHCRILLLSSLALSPLSHGIMAPLQTLPQLLLHSGYVIVLIIYQLPAALAIAGTELQGVAYKEICYHASFAVAFVNEILPSFMDLGIHEVPHRQVCEPDARPMLILFLITFVGFVIPVYWAYRLESAAKQDFLYCSLQRHYEHNTGPLGPIARLNPSSTARQQQQDADIRNVLSTVDLESVKEVLMEGAFRANPRVFRLKFQDVATLLGAAIAAWVLNQELFSSFVSLGKPL